MTQQIDFVGTVGKMIAAVLPGVAQMEQETRRERQAAGIAEPKKLGKYKGRIRRNDALRMIKRRAIQAEVSHHICSHTFRATGITEYMRNGGTLEEARQMAAHASPGTTNMYNRVRDSVTLDEVERIIISVKNLTVPSSEPGTLPERGAAFCGCPWPEGTIDQSGRSRRGIASGRR